MPTADPLPSPTNPSPGSSRAGSEEERAAYRPTAAQLLVLILLYFVLQVCLRSWISGSADLDEAEQLVLTQKPLWGYGPQPPLYTWIQIGFFKVFGVSIFALALLKNLLLLCTYLLTYLNARCVTGRHDCAAAAAASLLLIPQIAWESQRDLTHSVLASTLTAATLFLFLRARARPGILTYLAFGLCAGLGVLSKFNYALFFAGLILAAASLPEFRRVLLDRRMALAAVAGLILILPTGLWLLHHRDLALLSVSKFQIKLSAGWAASVRDGLASATKCTVTFLGPLALVYLVVFWRKAGRELLQLRSDYARVLLRMLAASATLVVLVILLFRVRDIHDRWLQPILIYAPVALMALLQARLDRARSKAILAIAALIAIAVSVCISGRILLAERLGRTEPLNRPFAQLAKELQPSVAGVPAIVTDTRLLAGNLRLNLADKTCLVPDLAPLFLEPGQRCALAWDATPNTNLPKTLAAFAVSRGMSDLTNTPAQFFSATFRFHHRRQMRIGVVVPPESQELIRIHQTVELETRGRR